MTSPAREPMTFDAMAAAIAAARGVDEALAAAAAVVAEEGGWCVAHAVGLDASGRLESKGWYLEDPDRFEPFRAVSDAFEIRDGTPPVQALRSGAAVWIEELSADGVFLRRQAAARCGLRAAGFLPVAGSDGPLGVIEVYSERPEDVLDPGRRRRTADLLLRAERALAGKRLAADAEAREDRFRAVFDGPVAMLLLDEALTVVASNEALAALLGRDQQELRGCDLASLAGAAAAGEVRAHLEAGGEALVEAPLDLAGGAGEPVSIRAWRAQGGGGEAAYVAIVDPQRELRDAVRALVTRTARRRAAVATLGAVTDEHALLTALAECVRSIAGTRYGCAALAGNHGAGLTTVVGLGPPEHPDAGVPAPQGVLAAYLLEGRPMRLADVHRHHAVGEPAAGGPGVTTFLGVPLVDRTRTVGHLFAADRTDSLPFDDADEAALLELAAIAAPALIRVRSAARARTASAVVQRLVRANLDLLREAQPDMVPRAAVDLARTVTDATYAGLLLVDPATEEVSAFLHSGMAPATATSIGDLPRARGLLGAALHAGRPMCLADLRAHPAHRGFPPHHPVMHSFLSVPVAGPGGAVGLLFCTDKASSAEFSETDEETVRRIAGAVAAALGTAPGEGDEILRHLAATQERLREQEEARWRFLGSLSHELRGAVAGIIMSAELLSDPGLGPVDEETARATNSRIVGDARNLMALLDNLLDLSRVQSHRLEVRMQPLDVQPAVADVLRELERQIADADLLVDVAPHDPLPRVLADPVRLRQVLVNLIGNAVKFTPRGGHVWVELTATEDDVSIAVCDTGVGIDPADLERLFEPFERGRAVRAEGAGLGLAIARAIVELHGGRLEATSWPDVGSRFAATFRVARGPHLTRAFDEAVEEHTGVAPGSGRVLLVEDDETSRETTSSILLTVGYEVRTATSCAAALAAIVDWPADLVLLDVQLPDGNGLDIVERLRELAEPRRVSIHAFTADRIGDTEERALRICDGFLLKPVAPRELLRRVREALDEREPQVSG